jgi:hypothetical protein
MLIREDLGINKFRRANARGKLSLALMAPVENLR